MERTVKISTLFLFLVLITCGLNLNAQGGRSMRGFGNDSIQLKSKNDTFRMHMSRRPGTPQGMRNPGRNMQGRDMIAYQGRGGMRDATSRRIMESIPGVTVKQKEELSKINEEHLKVMQDIREKNREALKKAQDDHKKKVDNLLSVEQKKWLEEN